MKVSLAFDINVYLHKCEEIADKYIKGNPLFKFVPWHRYPINGLKMEDRQEMIKVQEGVIREEPYLPYKCIPIVNSLLLWYIYDTTMVDIESFRRNLIYKKNGVDYYKLYMLHMDPLEIIRYYIDGISDTDTLVIENEIKNMFENSKMKRYVAPYVDYVFDFNTDEKIIILNVIGHIKEIRYDETLRNR